MTTEKTPCKSLGCQRLVKNEYCYWHDKRNKDLRCKPTRKDEL